MISKKTNIQLLVIITFFFNVIDAQTKPIEHTVSKGDNVYRLSLRYQVSMESIFKLNPGSKTLIKVGETLRIPNNAKTLPTEQNSGANTHFVSKGETKYGLSKKYNVSIAELEKANPSIVRMLIAGQTINIPSKNSGNQLVKNSSTSNEFHTIKKGETLWGISQKYNMPLETLKALNKDAIDVNLSIGQILALKETKNEVEEKNGVNTETYTVIKGDTKYGLSKRFNLSITELEQLNPEIISVLRTGTIIRTRKLEVDKNTIAETKVDTSDEVKDVETSSNENLEVEENVKSDSNLSVLWNDDFTFSGSKLNDEKAKYYKGLILAIDSINKEYPLNKLSITKSDTFNNDSLNTSLSKTYLHPFDNSINALNTTKSIDLFSIAYHKQDSLRKIFLKGLASDKDMRDRVLEYLKKENGHVICLYDNENLKNKDIIETKLPNVDFIKINRKGAFQSENLTDALRTTMKNFVIIESSDVGVFLNTTNILLKKMSTSDIQLVVLNPNNIPSKEKITSKRFKILRLLFPKQYNLELNKGMDNTVALSFAINYDALKRLYKKNNPEAFTKNLKTSVLGFSFNYELNNNVLENKAVLLFIFDKNSDHTLISKD